MDYCKITGLVLGRSRCQAKIDELNFGKALDKVDQRFKIWKTRTISILARNIAANSHGWSQLNFLATATIVPEKIINRASNTIRNYVWGNVRRFPGTKASLTLRRGGMSFPPIRERIAAAACHWLERAPLEKGSVWADTFLRELKFLGGNICGDTDTAVVDKQQKVSKHTKYVIRMACYLAGLKLEFKKYSEATPIFLNKKFIIGTGRKKRTLKPGRSLLYKSGVTCLGDFFDADGRLVPPTMALERGLPKGAFF